MLSRKALNRLTVTRQVAFNSVMKKADGKNRRCIIDVTLSLNGLPVVYRATYSAQTGLSYPQPVGTNAFNQPAVDACADRFGFVHVVWQVTGSGVNQIRYQRYPPGGGPPSPRDSILVQRVESVQNPTVRVGQDLGIHVAFITMSGGVPQVRYKRRHQVRGWDYGSTEITLPSDGGAGRPNRRASTNNSAASSRVRFMATP